MEFTYLAIAKLFQECFGLICYTEFKVGCDINLNAGEFRRNKCFVCTEIFRVRVQSLK